jgi:fatty-acyl-CoA synthase
MHYNDWLEKRERYTPGHEAVVDLSDDKRYTFRHLNRRANRLASVLQQTYQLSAGDRVSALSMNCMGMIDLFFACGKLGVIMVPYNFRLPAPAIKELIEDCTPSLLVYGSEFEETAAGLLQDRSITAILPFEGSTNSVDTIVNSDQPAPEIYSAEADDTAMILYTSGTTGKSKGAMISWKQIHWNSVNTAISLELTSADSTIVNTPFYHTGGWHVLLTPLMHHGGKVVLQPEFDPAGCLEIIEQEKVSILFAIPTMLRMMMEQEAFKSTNFSNLRFTICGGEACPIPVIKKYRALGVPIRQGYGLTEAGPNCYSLPAEDAIRKKGSVGFPNFHIDVKVVDDSGSEVQQGRVGELLMKGPHTFKGYWNNKEATQKTLSDGWVHTGDLFRCDEDGYYYIAGRKKEMYISGGENVYPVQVEKILYEHPAIAQVAVIGVPDDRWGETGCAFVVRHEDAEITADNLKSYSREYLAGFQCPGHVIFLDELPLGDSGKVQKKELAALFRDQHSAPGA